MPSNTLCRPSSPMGWRYHAGPTVVFGGRGTVAFAVSIVSCCLAGTWKHRPQEAQKTNPLATTVQHVMPVAVSRYPSRPSSNGRFPPMCRAADASVKPLDKGGIEPLGVANVLELPRWWPLKASMRRAWFDPISMERTKPQSLRMSRPKSGACTRWDEYFVRKVDQGQCQH
jgi:hypothetical protein